MYQQPVSVPDILGTCLDIKLLLAKPDSSYSVKYIIIPEKQVKSVCVAVCKRLAATHLLGQVNNYNEETETETESGTDAEYAIFVKIAPCYLISSTKIV